MQRSANPTLSTQQSEKNVGRRKLPGKDSDAESDGLPLLLHDSATFIALGFFYKKNLPLFSQPGEQQQKSSLKTHAHPTSTLLMSEPRSHKNTRQKNMNQTKAWEGDSERSHQADINKGTERERAGIPSLERGEVRDRLPVLPVPFGTA